MKRQPTALDSFAAEFRGALAKEIPLAGEAGKSKFTLDQKDDLHTKQFESTTHKTKASFSEVVQEKLGDMVQELGALRAKPADDRDDRRPLDISFAEYAHAKWGLPYSVDQRGMRVLTGVFDALGDGFDMSTSVARFFAESSSIKGGSVNLRWLVTEVFREAIYTGLNKQPIYQQLIRETVPVSGVKQIVMPEVKMSDAVAFEIGEAVDIPRGTVSVADKAVSIFEFGIGFDITDHAKSQLGLDMVSIFLQHMGFKLNNCMSNKAVGTLINGNDGSGNSISSIGTYTINTLVYKDLLRAAMRMGLLGFNPNLSLANESPILDMLVLPEVIGFSGGTTKVNVKTNVPMAVDQNFLAHLGVADGLLVLIDPMSAMLGLSWYPLTIETDRIVNKKMMSTQATVGGGFTTLFNQARLAIDKSAAFTSFPAGFAASGPDTEAFSKLVS